MSCPLWGIRGDPAPQALVGGLFVTLRSLCDPGEGRIVDNEYGFTRTEIAYKALGVMSIKIVQTGSWLYDDTVEMPVDVVALDYDWWYELAKADGQLEESEVPEALGSDGFLYYARFQRSGERNEPT